MTDKERQGGKRLWRRLFARAPGLHSLSRYRRADLRHDIAGGLSVAAIALPVGIA